MSLDPNNITLNKTSKLFEFEKQSRAIDEMDDIKLVKDLLKCYIKLYLKQAGDHCNHWNSSKDINGDQ